jgi:hypothetical protein
VEAAERLAGGPDGADLGVRGRVAGGDDAVPAFAMIVPS